MISILEKVDELPQIVAVGITAVIFGTCLVLDRTIRSRRFP